MRVTSPPTDGRSIQGGVRMVMLRLLLVFGFATSDLGGLRCFAGDLAATIDSVLA